MVAAARRRSPAGSRPPRCTVGRRELCSLRRDEPKPHLGRSVYLAKKRRTLEDLPLLPQHPILPLQLAQSLALLTRQDVGVLIAVGPSCRSQFRSLPQQPSPCASCFGERSPDRNNLNASRRTRAPV